MKYVTGEDISSGREFCNCGNLMNQEKYYRNANLCIESDYLSVKIIKIFTCPACENITIFSYSAGNFIEEDNHNPEYELLRKYRRVLLLAPKKQFHHAIPKSISDVINQAASVLESSPRASFILCRAVLEEICNDFNIPSEATNEKGKTFFVTLKDRLKKLFNQEKAPEDLIAVIEAIRELGNEGAHSDHITFSRQVKAQDADDLILLVNYVIEELYINKYRQKEADETLNNLKGKFASK